jgi:hypothetical protein
MTRASTCITFEAAPSAILEGTMIMTLKGAIPVQFLRAGDRVITRSGAVSLREISHRRISSGQVVRVREGALGHDRPQSELTLFAQQPVVVRGWRAKAIYGSDVAIVPASRLVDGDFIRLEVSHALTLYTLTFERAEVVIADGAELACAPELVAA